MVTLEQIAIFGPVPVEAVVVLDIWSFKKDDVPSLVNEAVSFLYPLRIEDPRNVLFRGAHSCPP